MTVQNILAHGDVSGMLMRQKVSILWASAQGCLFVFLAVNGSSYRRR